VATPTANLLRLLDLLQSRPSVNGREIAGHLGVDARTVRRYVATLVALDIPVEGERGVGGGYRLRPGFHLPPLMLDDDEAAVVALGLAAARRLGLGDATHVESALAKIRRVLPVALRGRVEALDDALGFIAAPDGAAAVPGERLLALADAVHRRRRVRLAYTSHAGERSEREASPHGLVVHAGRWYLAAHDHHRGELRTFRVDRIDELTLAGTAADPAPDGFDAAAHVAASMARVRRRWDVEIRLELPLDDARRRVPATLAELSADGDDRTLLRVQADSLEWTASMLAGLDARFTVLAPAELRAAVLDLAGRLMADARPAPAGS
jgi:predicted DNA-binding transcriptional regulator YafY